MSKSLSSKDCADLQHDTQIHTSDQNDFEESQLDTAARCAAEYEQDDKSSCSVSPQSWSFADQRAKAEAEEAYDVPLLARDNVPSPHEKSAPLAFQKKIYVRGKSSRHPSSEQGHSGQRFAPRLQAALARIDSKNLLRQALLLVFGTAFAWIPGLVAMTFYGAGKGNDYATPAVVQVGLFWWSVWLSVIWLGIWICWLLALCVPNMIRFLSAPMGDFGESLYQQIIFVIVVQKYLAWLLWSILLWISYVGIIWLHFPGHNSLDPSLVNPLQTSNGTNGTSTGSKSSSSGSSLSGDSSTNITSTLWPDTSDGSATSSGAVPFDFLASPANLHVSASRFFFALTICAALLLAEKLVIQNVAHSFHAKTYSDRIKQVKYKTSVLVKLYVYAQKHRTSTPLDPLRAERNRSFGNKLKEKANLPHLFNFKSRDDESPRAQARTDGEPTSVEDLRPLRMDWTSLRQRLALKAALQAGPHLPILESIEELIRHPLVPERVIEATLESARETRKLAARLFGAYAIIAKDSEEGEGGKKRLDERVFELNAIAPLFASRREAKHAFAVFDLDHKGSCTREEMTRSCLEIHKERVGLLTSMHDVDQAVAKLDHLLAAIWAFVSCVIVAAMLSIRFSTLVASLGTIVLSLSWLFSTTAEECLSSIVWVFNKHPLDVGDCVVVPGLLSQHSASYLRDQMDTLQGFNDGDTFIVEEIMLLSTRMRTQTTNKSMVISNNILAQYAIVNLRRSGPISEPQQIKVAYDTPFEKIEALREAMSAWICTQQCDFRPGIDIDVGCLSTQSELTLTLEIRYRSNWQDFALRQRRRNRWMSALKYLMKVHGIRSPSSQRLKAEHGPRDAPSRPDVEANIPLFDFIDDSSRCDYLDEDRNCVEDSDSNDDEASHHHSKLGDDSLPIFNSECSRLNDALLPRHVSSESNLPSSKDQETDQTYFRQHGATTRQVDDSRALGQGYHTMRDRSWMPTWRSATVPDVENRPL